MMINMKASSLLLILTLIFTSTFSNAQPNRWVIDKNHSNVTFDISYFGIGTVKGAFDEFEGSMKMTDFDVSNATFEFTIKAGSINTNQEQRDKHLRSEDFFNVAKNPTIKFISKSIDKLIKDQYKVTGILTMGGVSKEIDITLLSKGSFVHPRFKKTVTVFEISGIIPREDFGVGTAYGPASKALGKAVNLTAQIQLQEESKED